MQQVKTFVRKNNTTTIVCPGCNLTKNIPVGIYRDKKHFLKVRCPCGQIFLVLLDFRQYYRKKTQLSGVIKVLGSGYVEEQPVEIENLSFSGVGFKMELSKYMRIGQRVMVEFYLDGKKKQFLKKELVLKVIRGSYLGGQFIDIDPFEKELGFFLKS
ncbi:MAG: PilZ domain-containing protein [Desulfobulbaceae bacterium]|nr:PilZ domain-containing protein [Desulfobulbaceae bacterium]